MLKKFSCFMPLILILSLNAFATETGDTAPDVSLADHQVGGAVVQQSILTRNKPGQYLLLDFFSTTCSACISEMSTFSKLAKEIAGTTTVRQVGLDRQENLLVGWLQDYSTEISYSVASDSNRLATHAYGIEYTPTHILVDPSGKVIMKLVDSLSDDTVAQIKQLVGVTE